MRLLASLPQTKMLWLLTMAWLAYVSCLTRVAMGAADVRHDAANAQASHHTVNSMAVMPRLQTLESPPRHVRSGTTSSGTGARLARGAVKHPAVQPIQLHPDNRHYFLFRGEVRACHSSPFFLHGFSCPHSSPQLCVGRTSYTLQASNLGLLPATPAHHSNMHCVHTTSCWCRDYPCSEPNELSSHGHDK